MKATIEDPAAAQILAPSFGLRFSGINATMETVVPALTRRVSIACCGANLSEDLPRTTLARWLRNPSGHRVRIFHARRNNDMVVGIVLRWFLGRRLRLLFTSAAQRRHTRWTRWLYRRMDAVIATTDRAAELLDRDATVIRHGVDHEQFHPGTSAAVRRSLGLPNQPTIGVFGRLRPQKGTGDLIEAAIRVFAETPDWRIVFVGAATPEHQPDVERWQRRIDDAGLHDRIVFQGYVREFADLPRWHRAMDVTACVSRNEGFGVTCLEALATERPVLATRAGAWAEILDEGRTGWLADPGDIDSIENALRRVVATPDSERREMGREGRRTIEARYTVAHEADRIEAVYRRLLADDPHSRVDLTTDSVVTTVAADRKAA